VVLFGRQPLIVWHDNQLGETLASFRKEKSHIAVVRNVNDRGLVKFEIIILKISYPMSLLQYLIFLPMTKSYSALLLSSTADTNHYLCYQSVGRSLL
jgi:hypothetical protein